MLHVAKIDSLAGLASLKGEWDQLLENCSHRTPFLSHEWTTVWWKHFGEGKQLCVLVVRNDERAVLIAPLMKYTGRFHDRYLKLPVRIVETTANYHSNRADFIFRDLNPSYLGAIWDYLLKHEDWHLFRMYPVFEAAPTLPEFRVLMESTGTRAIFTHCQTSPYLPLQEVREQFTSCIPKDLYRRIRKLGREDQHFNTDFVTDETGIDEALNHVFEISAKG